MPRMDNFELDLQGLPVQTLQLQLLGGFSVRLNGAEVPTERWPGLRAVQLVQLLGLQPQRRLARDLVMDALWPQFEPDASSANLRKAVHHARHALGRHDAVRVHGGEVLLWPGRPVVVDAEDFERVADAALSQRDAAACAEAARTYSGALLPGSLYEAWTVAARERLHARHLELLRVAGHWDAVAQLEPTDEAAHRALMQRELQAGNRAAALRWYAHLREALQESLSVAPDRQTAALYERCVAGLQSTGPAFVGRALEIAQSLAWLDAEPSVRAGAIVLRGPGGIGKTALSSEIGTQALARGWRVHRVQATDARRVYAVVTAIAERLLLEDRAPLDRIGDAARNVLGLLTPLAAPSQPLPGPLGRHQVVGAIRRLLVASAEGDDVLLQIDDGHLADDADVDVLMQIAMSGAPVCLLLAVRPMAGDSVLTRGVARLELAGALKVLDLQGLDDEEIHRLAQRAAPAPLATEVAARVVSAAQGNPFAAIELARCAALTHEDRLPASTAQAVLARLCDVPEPAMALLTWLALCGDSFDLATIEALAEAAAVSAMPALDAGLTEGVLTPAGSRYVFRHELVRQALLDQVPLHRRTQMHRRIAELLTRQAGAPADIAHHWRAGGKPREAIPWLVDAAREAVRLAAFSDALRLLQPVLEVDATHVEALRWRAEALDAMGDPAALPAYRLAAEAADETAAHNLLAKAALAQVKQGDPKGALEVLAGLHPTSVEGRLCEALAYSGAAALGAADPAMGTAKAAAARRLALQTGDTASIVVASWAQAAAAHARGELRESVWADLNETTAVPHLALRVFDGHLCITQRFLYGARPYADVIAFADALSTEAKRLGAARGHAFGITLRGEAEWLSGDLVSARLHLREGARLHRLIGGAVGEALSLQRLAELALYEGQKTEARALVDEALDLARQTDIGFHLLDRIYGTRIALHADDPAAALHVMQDAAASVRGPLETCPGCRITFAVPAAIAAARAGEVDQAEQHERQCAYLADVVMRLPAWYAAHDEVRGHIAASKGAAASETTAHFTAAATRFRSAGHPVDAARCERLGAQARGP